jgi:hypothetical protein
MSIKLKIKAVSLQDEARYIRKHERRFLKHARLNVEGSVEARSNFNSLQQHRKLDVRREARATHLARAALKGTPYRRVEEKSHEEPPYLRVHQLLRKYGSFSDSWSVERVRDWFASEEGARLAA